MKAYDPQTGGYKEEMSPYDMYHSWAASQYKSKVRVISIMSPEARIRLVACSVHPACARIPTVYSDGVLQVVLCSLLQYT